MNINRNGIKILLPHQPHTRKCFKIRHLTRAEAFDHLVALEIERGERGLNVFRCKHCGGFHVGHPPEVKP